MAAGFQSLGQASVRDTAARRLRIALLAGTALTFIAPPALAQTAQAWNGSVSTDWFNGGNWDSLTAPSAGDSVTIDTVTPRPTVMSGGTADLDGLNVGFTGTGNLTVNGGAAVTVTSNNLIIGGDLGGTFTGANGTMVLDASTLIVTGAPPGSGTIFVGASGTGSFTVQSLSIVATVYSYVGHLPGATGIVTVDNSTWTNSGDSFIGNRGTGVFNVLNGGSVAVIGNTDVGADTTGNGTISISGAGSSWSTDSLTILGGNALTPAGGTGTINVSNGSTYIATGQMFVGLVGTGALNITGGGQVTSANDVYLGFTSGATGTVTISGAGSTWTANGGVTVVGGNDGSVPVGGNGTINVLNGATFDTTAGDVVLGNDPFETSNGTVNVSGATWNASGIFVGESGNGTLNITNAATVTADLLIAGDCFCSQGTVNVSGGSALTVTSDVILGFDGIGTMNVSGTGTVVTMRDLYLGLSGGTGTLNVSGPANVTERDLFVGYGGTGIVNVQNGASMTTTQSVTIGVLGGANGTVNVSGAGSTLTINDSVVIGNGGVGTGALNVFDGGAVNVTNFVFNADRVFVSAGSVISANTYIADFAATTTFGLRSSSSGQINLGVVGTASLAGALVITGHNSVRTTYTLLSSSDLGGSTFDTVTYTAALSNPVLTYTTGDVLLTVDAFQLASSLPPNANRNQRAVAQSLDNVVAAGTALPAGLDYVFNLTGDALLGALTQLSGEIGAAPIQAMFNASNQFMNLMSGRGGGAPGGYTVTSYAPEKRVDRRAAEAYAAVTPRDARAPGYDLFMPRWNAWASGYGGNSTVKGNAATGSSDATTRIYGMAAGADYRFSPDTLAGFALGGAGLNFGVLGGSGRADVFQAGAYGRHYMGQAYVSGVLAYGWQHVTTDRTVTVLRTDRLEASFNAQTLAARLEGGYRFDTAWAGVTPYAALQSTSFFLPSYAELAVSGSNQFALSYGSQTQTNLRTELGWRADRSFAIAQGLLKLYGRAAWAHDSNSDRPATATFQTLPGATFTVNAAKPTADGALLTAGAEMKWMNGWSVVGLFEGEFSRTTASYAGRGAVKYSW